MQAERTFTVCRPSTDFASWSTGTGDPLQERHWFAVYTVSQHEKSVTAQLGLRSVDCFLPTYQEVRVWKNRQRVQVTLPLFPGYLFVRIGNRERARVLSSPGVIRMVGNSKGPIPIPDSAIDFLRSDFCRDKLEPYRDLVVGQSVRIKSGAMQGVQGVLVRKNNSCRFVLSIDPINQHAVIEVSAENLEPIAA